MDRKSFIKSSTIVALGAGVLVTSCAEKKVSEAVPGTSRNIDWIIDAVAGGVDVDMASPHNRYTVTSLWDYCN